VHLHTTALRVQRSHICTLAQSGNHSKYTNSLRYNEAQHRPRYCPTWHRRSHPRGPLRQRLHGRSLSRPFDQERLREWLLLHGRWRKTVQMQSRLACECSLPQISSLDILYSHNVPSVHARLLITSHRGGRLEVSLVHRVVLRYFVRLLILRIFNLSVDLLGLPQACQWRTPVHRWSLQQGLDVWNCERLALEMTIRATNQICRCRLGGLEDYPCCWHYWTGSLGYILCSERRLYSY
jgi:hypothetical protein